MTNQNNEGLDEKELRKAWLKQLFISYEYHEKLLALHERWYALIKEALARPEVKRNDPESFRFFTTTAFTNFDRVPKPGVWTPELYRERRTSGSFRAISDYGQLMYPNYWEWMTEDERKSTNDIWLIMSQMCLNIRQAIDGLWFNPRKGNDDAILNERYTGPIDYPSNWREQVLGPQGALLFKDDAPRIKAGSSVPQAGTYVALDPRERRFKVAAGDELPDLKSAYGITIWQRIGD